MKAMKVAKEWPSHLKTEPEIAEAARIHERYAQRKSKAAISLRLEQEQIEKAKRIAAHKSICYQTQTPIVVAEGIERTRRNRQLRGGPKGLGAQPVVSRVSSMSEIFQPSADFTNAIESTPQ